MGQIKKRYTFDFYVRKTKKSAGKGHSVVGCIFNPGLRF